MAGEDGEDAAPEPDPGSSDGEADPTVEADDEDAVQDDEPSWWEWAFGWLSWEWIRKNAGLGTVVLTGSSLVAYVVGLVPTGKLASELGVTTAELGIDFRDQVLVAAFVVLAVLVLLATVLAVALAVGIDRPRLQRIGLGLIAAALSAGYAYVFFWVLLSVDPFTSGVLGKEITGATPWATPILVFSFLAFNVVRDSSEPINQQALSRVGVEALLAVAGLALVFATYMGWEGASSYAERLLDGDGGASSFVLRLVLPLETGTLIVDGESYCVERIGGDVFVGGDGVVSVIPTWEQFSVMDCTQTTSPRADQLP